MTHTHTAHLSLISCTPGQYAYIYIYMHPLCSSWLQDWWRAPLHTAALVSLFQSRFTGITFRQLFCLLVSIRQWFFVAIFNFITWIIQVGWIFTRYRRENAFQQRKSRMLAYKLLELAKRRTPKISVSIGTIHAIAYNTRNHDRWVQPSYSVRTCAAFSISSCSTMRSIYLSIYLLGQSIQDNKIPI